MSFVQIHYKPEVTITKAGRINLPSELVNPYRYDTKKNFILGADILYSAETDELAFDIYRKETDTARYTYKRRPTRASKDLGASLFFDYSYALDAKAYLPLFNFDQYLPHFKALEESTLDPVTNQWKTVVTKWVFECYQIDNFIIIKLNPNNPNSQNPALFKKITPKRFRKANEITLSKRGLLTLPRQPVETISRKCDIAFDPASQTFQLTFTPNGSRTVHKDCTIRLDTFMKHHKLQIPERLYLNYELDGNTLTFRLDDLAPDTHEMRRVQQALGVLR